MHGSASWWNCVECAYPPQMASALMASGVNVDYGNYGIGSETMRQMLDKFDTAIAPLFADRSRVRISIPQGGGNDIGPNPVDPEAKAHEIFDIAVTYARRVHALGGKIVITTITPSNPTYGDAIGFNFTTFESARQRYNSLVRSSNEFDAVVDRGADPLAGCPTCADDQSPEDGYQNAVFLDGVHETSDECRRWAEQVVAVLRSLLY